MTSSDRGKLLWGGSLVVPLGGCSDLSAGAAFVAFFHASILVLVIYSFVVGWIRRDFKRPVWLASIYAITVGTIATTVLAKVFGFGDADVLKLIGFVSFATMGLAMALEAVLGMFGVKVDLGLPEGAGMLSIALYGLILLLVGAAVVEHVVDTW